MDNSNRSLRSPRFIIHFSIFMLGGCGLAYEYTLSKISSDLLGNSARQWAIIIGIMMFFMGVGSDIQKFLKDRGLFDKFIVFEIALGLFGGFGPIAMLCTYGVLPSHFVLVQYFFICVVGLIIGLEIPLLARINEFYTRDLKYNIGSILKMDYIGALVGALVWVFLLTKFFTIIQTAFILGLLNVITASIALLFFRGMVLNFRPLFTFAVVCIACLVTGLLYAKEWTSYGEQYLYRDRIILSKTTEFQHIVLTQSTAGDISCYINGHLQFNSSDENIYHENLVHPAMSIVPRKGKVLVLGGGDGLAVREILKYSEVQKITLVDIDPEMVRLAKDNSYFQKLNDMSLTKGKVNMLSNHGLEPIGKEEVYVQNKKFRSRLSEGRVASVSVVAMDAAKFVEKIAGRFDVIIIDFPDPNALELSKLYSIEFYQHLKKKLAADGFLVQQSTSPVHAREAFLCIGRTMKQAGFSAVPYHDNVPSFGEWGWWICGHQDRYSSQEIKNRLGSISSLHKSTQYLTPELIRASLEFGKGQLETSESDVTTLMDSRVYEYYLQGWSKGL